MLKFHWLTNLFPNTPRSYVVAFFLYIVVMLTSSAVVGYLSFFVSTDYYTPEIVFTNRFENALDGSLCPGENLYFRLHWRMKHQDTVARFYESWYDVDSGDVIYSSGPSYDIISDNKEHSGLFSKVVPPLYIGRYEYRRAVFYSSLDTSVVRVPFEISHTCPPEILPTPRPPRKLPN